MKAIGLLFILCGIGFAIYSLNLDTSVFSSQGEKINNIGLLSKQQNFVILSGFVFIAGIIMLVCGKDNLKDQVIKNVN